MKLDCRAKYWLDELSNYSTEQLLKKPNESSWSLGQVYVHLMLASDHFFMENAKKCVQNEGQIVNGGKNRYGKLLFLIGRFPPMKFKMPGSGVEPRQPDSIDYVKPKLERSIQIIHEVSGILAGYNAKLKVKHPAFGYLNAMEWYRMNEMHFAHHRRQKKQLDKFLKMG
jgi:hypothetical protein